MSPHPKNGRASSTPTTDGERVYAFLGNGGLVAVGFDGTLAWHRPLGPFDASHGTAGSRQVVAYDPETGRELWRAAGAGYSTSRALRSWRERIQALERTGFIEVKPKAARNIGYILIRHPRLILANLREDRKIEAPLWQAYVEICHEFGIETPDDPLASGPRRVLSQDVPQVSPRRRRR